MKFEIFLISLSVIVTHIEASNILAVWPILSKSHFSVGIALFEKLAENGHTVSRVVQCTPDKFSLKINFINDAFWREDNAYQPVRTERITSKHQVR